ncbi:MAG TPA: CvpA family protein [Candidatus Merdibacter merdavium]|uniref:CvpA family protein n=1 Tax=Candidatus Merdibacter merdavium TaxID=2838692 RepID=A0A9D2NS35_9FIRM|nr:CvpA family protein [Candidatus Merdibacter merdavium]
MEMNWILIFDIILIICLAAYLARAWQRGFLLQLIDLVSWAAAAVLAWWLSDVLADVMPFIQVQVSDVDMLNGFFSARISAIAWFVIILLLIRLVTWILHPFAKALAHVPLVGWFNHVLGMALGALKAFILLYVLLVILYLPLIPQGAQIVQRSLLRYVEPLYDAVFAQGAQIIDELKLAEGLQGLDERSEALKEELEEWIRDHGEEDAVSQWLESLQQ